MPTFDVVSQLDMQEVRNAVDQARREVSTRFDFRGTDSEIDLDDEALTLHSSSEDRLAALRVVLEEKLVRRSVSLKALEWGRLEEASGGRARQKVTLRAGIATDKAKAINRFIKDNAAKGVSSQTQGDQVRVTGKKRDDLQAVIAALKAEDFDLPLQFINFRD
ncbi:MAG: YajQ family cyclic di-GMP-binding protein [Acidimicrobiia bacterium]|nr:YajQ family cyclic di-GMP-binding protein [Acidimicrobiia bacterium]